VQGAAAKKSQDKGKQVERDDEPRIEPEQPQRVEASEQPVEEEYNPAIHDSSELPTSHEVILKDHIKVSFLFSLRTSLLFQID
jgi:hypothetical protein